MKTKMLFLVVAALFMQNVFAQEKLLTPISVQENIQEGTPQLDTIAIAKTINTISYNLILEFGFSTGIERYYYKDQYNEEMGLRYSAWGFSLIAINNISLQDRFLLGIGGGLEYRNIGFPIELAGTCFLNFRCYFNKPEKNVIPLLNISIGGRMVKEFDGLFAKNPWHLSETKYGVYSAFGAGFKVKLFSLQGGALFWTKGYNSYSVDAMVRVGLSF